MTQLTYYPPPDTPRPAPEPAPDRHDGLRWGYTLADLEQMTRAALLADRSMAADITDRRDAAWHAIAEHLCTAEHPPTRAELIRTGWQAIYREVRDGYRHYGYQGRNPYAGHASAPEFARYWYQPVQPSHEERIVEHLAATQVFDQLTPARRHAVTALAATGDWTRAAALLGITYNTFNQRIRAARKAFAGLWHEGETPHWSQYNRTRRVPSRVEASTHCPREHERTPDTTRVSARITGGQRRTTRTCIPCEKERTARRAAARKAKAGAA